jgi:hypothetical protein
MLPRNVFIDTEIFLDNIIPERRNQFKCSCLLIDEVSKGNLVGVSADYVLSEIMGNLKTAKEVKKGTAHLSKETLTSAEKAEIQSIVSDVKNIPHLTIFKPIKEISQMDIYNMVSNLCIQTKDALVLLTALDARNKLGDIGFLTRDEKLLVRSRSQINSFHPVAYISKCPSDCQSKLSCSHHK